MTRALGLLGWVTAASALASLAGARRRADGRMELVARAAHELRGPLTAARLGLDALEHGATPGPVSVAAVERELCRARLALDDLAAAQDGRRVADAREPVAVGDLLAEVVTTWEPVARAFGGELRLARGSAGAMVRGDRQRLAQACANLLANAVEHGGRSVELRGRCAGDRVRIEVADDGPGLPAPVADLARGARRGRGRRGRGLAIASEIAARHGGRLAAAPSERGARLALELPLAAGAR